MSLPLYKKIFYILVFLLPLNLGKHVIFSWSYVDGLLIDYLIPTFYLIDAVLIALLVTWFIELFRQHKSVSLPINAKYFPPLIFFVFSIFLSCFSALRVTPAIYAFTRLFAYALLALYVYNEVDLKRDFLRITTVLGFTVLFLSIMAFLQWSNQSSLFDNYLFFGEQPYTSATPGIAIKNFFGIAKVPPYALFRHPNIFAGFLSIVLLWILKKKTKFSLLIVALGSIAIFFTLSRTAGLALLLGLFLNWFLANLTARKKFLVTFTLSVIFVIGLLFSTIPEVFTSDYFTKNPSVYRRANFILSSLEAIKRRPLFGIGLNNSTVLIERFLPPARDIRFAQPVHNIFILTFAESGIFAFTSLIWLLGRLCMDLLKRNSVVSKVLFISIFQVVLLGSFDHYIFTIHQTFLLFWLIVGMSARALSKDIDTPSYI